MTTDDVITAARQGEPERYLAALLAPEPLRSRLLSVAGFAAELRRVPVAVNDPMMGEIRLQWWRDAIATFGAEATTGHPVADALAETVTRRELPTAPLLAMTEARAFDLYDDAMPDDTAFDGYLTRTEALPFDLALSLAGNGAASAVATMAARAYGEARLLADLPHWLSRARVPLPLTALTAAGIDPETLLAGEDTPAVRAFLAARCDDIARAHRAAIVAVRALPRPQRIALLPLAVVPRVLRLIVAKDRHPLRTPVELSPLARITRITAAHWFGP